jgi:predicted metal-dependent hydrolase
MNTALPHFSLRESRRARHVILRAVPGLGLEVVVPPGFDRRELPRILDGKRSWIERALRRLPFDATTPDAPPALPERLDLSAVGLSYSVHVLDAPDRAKLTENAGRLLLRGGDEAGRLTALRTWVQAKAREQLAPWLRNLSRETGLTPSGLRVRNQRTRWGSCSRAGIISLNCKLLFLPRDLAEQVLVHELCHLRQMNHSTRFWALVESFRPGGRVRERGLRQAFRSLPPWIG